MMRGSWLILLGLVSLLSACLTTGKRGTEQVPEVFDFGPPPTLQVTRPQPIGLEVRVPAWLDSPAIDYRLAYLDAAQPRQYAYARWAAPPSQLLQARLQRSLGMVANGQVKVACVLRLEIDAFSQIFASPTASHALLQGRALWLDRQRGVLETMPFREEEPCASADAAGGVQAQVRAIERLATRLQEFERAASRLGGCR